MFVNELNIDGKITQSDWKETTAEAKCLKHFFSLNCYKNDFHIADTLISENAVWI